MTRLRTAVIGAGHLGKFHARLAAGLEQFELVAVADPSEPHRTAVAGETGARAVADYKPLLSEIDAA
ncbi:MAG: Gfo/Idh/MocA family oxidoreductase, partial [Planctomycetales bacterium]|nr:Gfo/Idh/MocA family oxidoreductase [Planctomycetales bacterium]